MASRIVSDAMKNIAMKKHSYDYYLNNEQLEKFTPIMDCTGAFTLPENYSVEALKDEYKILREKYIKLQSKLKGRVNVERAKEIVMNLMKCSADDAMKKLQSIASNNNITIEEICDRLVMVKGVLV